MRTKHRNDATRFHRGEDAETRSARSIRILTRWEHVGQHQNRHA
jgi:hypothetical protein